MSPERVLVVPSELFDRLGRFQGFVPDAERYLADFFAPGVARFLERDKAEEDPSFKQIIPYVILRCGGEVFAYTRGKSQGESRLHAKRSIGIGGHVDESDADGAASRAAYDGAVLRELGEEVAIAADGSLRCIGLINDDATPVGQVHLGVVHLYDLDRPRVDAREDGIAESGFIPIAQLAEERDRLESWSRLVADAVLLG
jgi:predicted NUDIX family phosphoesterase